MRNVRIEQEWKDDAGYGVVYILKFDKAAKRKNARYETIDECLNAAKAYLENTDLECAEYDKRRNK